MVDSQSCQEVLTEAVMQSAARSCHAKPAVSAVHDNQSCAVSIRTRQCNPHVCRFAQRMRCVANDFVVNIRKEPTAIIRKYEQDIKELQQELAMHDSLTERHGIVYEPYGDVQKAQVQADVQAWLQSDDALDSIAPLQLVSLRHIKEVLFAAKVRSCCQIRKQCEYIVLCC